MNAAERRYDAFLHTLPCVVGTFTNTPCAGPVGTHHVAPGSSIRSEYAKAPICWGHHQGPAGLHGLGPKRFVTLYRPPQDSEYGLLIWTAQLVADNLPATHRDSPV